MGSSKQTTKTDLGPWGPTQAPLTEQGIPRIEAGYQKLQSNPLIPQAQQYTQNVLGGQYLDPNTNPHLGALTKSITDPIRSSVSAQFGRAGRGTSASTSGLAGAMTQAMTSGLAAPLFQQYNIERGFQDQASRAAPAMAALDVLPEDWWLQQMTNLGRLGQKGSTTTTSTPSAGQTIAGIGLTALGMMSGNPMMAMGSMGGSGLSGGMKLPWMA